MDIESLKNLDISKIIISGCKDKENKFQKLTGKKILIGKNIQYQFESEYNKKIYHENTEPENLYEYITFKMQYYKQADIFCIDGSHYMIFNKKDEMMLVKVKDEQKMVVPVLETHNRQKNYIINEGDRIPVFVELGIFTKDYKTVNSMYKKFKQINRFIELFDDAIVKKYGTSIPEKTLEVIDFGCGKSYLTFILFYYLTSVKKYKVNITGLDLKEEVVENCNALSKKYGYDKDGLKFDLGDINGYKGNNPEFKVDIVVSLHGCDTATDYALYNAVKWNAEIIFVVPCCEHEVGFNIDISPMQNMLRHGIIKERFCSLATNSIRCDILELCGYKTEILEFVDITHSPKNLLIRAVKSVHPMSYKGKIKKDLETMISSYKINQTLYNLICVSHNVRKSNLDL